MAPAVLNRKFRGKNDHLNCALVGKERAIEACDLSRMYGSYDGPPGDVMFEWGKKELYEKYNVLVKEKGGIDKRCKAVRDGDIFFKKDGNIDGRCKFSRQFEM